jgi:nicotinamide-nucleotide amidase
MLPPSTLVLAETVLADCRARGDTIVTAESCTGGLIAAALTHIPGSSDVIERGFVTYSNAAKSELLGVPPEMIERHGAVSEPVARAMAEGALKNARATLAVSVTGIAGPGGGTAEKPLGLVWFAFATKTGCTTHQKHFEGDRSAIRAQSVLFALNLISNPTARYA